MDVRCWGWIQVKSISRNAQRQRNWDPPKRTTYSSTKWTRRKDHQDVNGKIRVHKVAGLPPSVMVGIRLWACYTRLQQDTLLTSQMDHSIPKAQWWKTHHRSSPGFRVRSLCIYSCRNSHKQTRPEIRTNDLSGHCPRNKRMVFYARAK